MPSALAVAQRANRNFIYTRHLAIVSNSASQLFSTGRPLYFVPLPLSRSLYSSICRLCVFQVCRLLWRVPLKSCRWSAGFEYAAPVVRAALDCAVLAALKRVLTLRRDFVARYRRSQFYNNKNFFKKQVNVLYALPRRYKSYLAFVLYVYRENFFFAFV